METRGTLQQLLDFLDRLRAASIHFELRQHRPEAVAVDIAVPGERWEVEFFPDGHIEVEVFGPSTGVVGEEALERLFREYSD